jgi:hypothetical protein
MITWNDHVYSDYVYVHSLESAFPCSKSASLSDHAKDIACSKKVA